MPLLLPLGRRSLDSCDDALLREDPRVEPSSSHSLRPLTSEPQLVQRRFSLSGDDTEDMPPTFPMPLSVQSLSDARSKPQTFSPPQRRTFLPQLPHAKSFAVRRTSEENPADPDDDESLDPATSAVVADEDTDAFKQAMWAGQANILVTVRVRPSCSHDRDALDIVRVLDHKLIVVLDKPASSSSSPQRTTMDSPVPVPAVTVLSRRGGKAAATHGLRKLRPVASAHPGRTPLSNNQQLPPRPQHRSREKQYAFDYVFTAQDGQHTVYHHTTKFLIHGVLHGFNATVFAYGCTGAGKTYTMLGTHDEPGIMALTLDDLFENIAHVHADPQAMVQYKVTVSFLEVYNENIRDLLATGPPASGLDFLDLREDPIKGPVVAGISEVEASNARDVMKLLRRGHRHRSQEATAVNAVSSRSHAVLQVLVEQRDKHSSVSGDGGVLTSSVKFGKLSLVDLAGSERAAVTQNRGQRLIEGANINRSLLALGNCINALGEKQGHGSFVPYRDSKLTRLLKDSLGGNCRTVMIANVSPAAASMEETLNTLKYANRAKNIKTTVTRNVLMVDHHLTAYASVVAELKDEIVTLKTQLAVQGSATAASPVGRQLGIVLPDEHAREDAWTQGKLAEARGYIAQCFQQRQQLQCRLLEMDHCIEELTRQLHAGDTMRGPEALANENKSTKESNGHNDPQQTEEEDVTQQERLEDGLRQCVDRKRQLVAQLERNHSVMDDFRGGIQQSPLLATNEFLRDVLLMEYRVGDLQVENAVLAWKQTLKDHQLTLLRGRLSGLEPHETTGFELSYLCRTALGGDLPSLDMPAPLTEMTRLLTASPVNHKMVDETPEVHSTRSTTRFAFLDELRDRFYDRSKKESTTSGQRDHERLSPRRQWGIQLNNASLPYIRLKKKSQPSPAVGMGNGAAVSAYVSTTPKDSLTLLSSGSQPSATAAPYLKVLKHRRKLQHRSSSSHKQLPGLH